MPAWVASIVHVPALTKVTVEPDIVQFIGICEVKLTGRPDEAVALTVKGEAPYTWSASGPK